MSKLINIKINIFPRSLVVLEYTISCDNIESKLLEIFNQIYIEYPVWNPYFIVQNRNGTDNPTLSDYSHNTNKLELLNTFQLYPTRDLYINYR